jgi:molecular chaperone DnaJ
MNLREAYSILEIDPSSSDEEVKKKYKVLAKKYHPDICKEANADDKFKKINQAFETIQKGEDPRGNPFGRSQVDDIFNNPFGFNVNNDVFETFFGQKRRMEPDTIIELVVSFKESVLGTKAPLKFKKQTACTACEGTGSIHIPTDCNFCGGRGKVTFSHGGMRTTQICGRCNGKQKYNPCTICKSGRNLSEVEYTIQIPPGITNGANLRLGGAGNFDINSQTYADVILTVKVTELDNLKVIGRDVHSNLTLSLKDAVLGKEVNVNTIDGIKKIIIPKRTKNKDIYNFPNLGVNREGSHIVNINVEYPNDIEDILVKI